MDRIAREYDEIRARGPAQAASATEKRPSRPSQVLENQVKGLIADLDDQGRWLVEERVRPKDPGSQTGKVITADRFVRNVRALTQYLGATRP